MYTGSHNSDEVGFNIVRYILVKCSVFADRAFDTLFSRCESCLVKWIIIDFLPNSSSQKRYLLYRVINILHAETMDKMLIKTKGTIGCLVPGENGCHRGRSRLELA